MGLPRLFVGRNNTELKLGHDYPYPIVNLKEFRDRALSIDF